MWNKNNDKKVLVTVDDQDLNWVRKTGFGCLAFETGIYLKDNMTNDHIIFLGFCIEDIPGKPEGFVQGAIYYVEKSDIDNHPVYKQSPNWENTPWIAPGGAVDWKKEKATYDIVT